MSSWVKSSPEQTLCLVQAQALDRQASVTGCSVGAKPSMFWHDHLDNRDDTTWTGEKQSSLKQKAKVQLFLIAVGGSFAVPEVGRKPGFVYAMESVWGATKKAKHLTPTRRHPILEPNVVQECLAWVCL